MFKNGKDYKNSRKKDDHAGANLKGDGIYTKCNLL